VNTALQDRARSGQPHLVDRQQRKLRRTSIRSRSTTSVAEQSSSSLDAAEHHDPLSQAAEKKNAPTFQDAIQKLQVRMAFTMIEGPFCETHRAGELRDESVQHGH
jgi:hypothetical protein